VITDLNGNEGHDLPWAAKRLGLSVHTVRALARRRELAHVRAGRRLIFYEADCADYLRRHRVEVARSEAER
jgi:excisionase family DNA binding protein